MTNEKEKQRILDRLRYIKEMVGILRNDIEIIKEKLSKLEKKR